MSLRKRAADHLLQTRQQNREDGYYEDAGSRNSILSGFVKEEQEATDIRGRRPCRAADTE